MLKGRRSKRGAGGADGSALTSSVGRRFVCLAPGVLGMQRDPVLQMLETNRAVSQKLSASGGETALNSEAFEAAPPVHRSVALTPSERSMADKMAELTFQLQVDGDLQFDQADAQMNGILTWAVRELELDSENDPRLQTLLGQIDACLDAIDSHAAEAERLAQQLGLEEGLPLASVVGQSVDALQLGHNAQSMSLVQQLEACSSALARGGTDAPPEDIPWEPEVDAHMDPAAAFSDVHPPEAEAPDDVAVERQQAAQPELHAQPQQWDTHVAAQRIPAAAHPDPSAGPGVAVARVERRRAAATMFGGGIEWWATPHGKATLLVGLVGLVDGVGMKAWSSGLVYDGSWRAGLRQGYGRFTWANGLNMYDGMWADDVPHGKGTVTLADGTLFVGQFVRGIRHGPGEEKTADGAKRRGTWENDEPGSDVVQEDASVTSPRAVRSSSSPVSSQADDLHRIARVQEFEDQLAQLRSQQRRRLSDKFPDPAEPKQAQAPETQVAELDPAASLPAPPQSLPTRANSRRSPRVRAVEDELEQLKEARAQRTRTRPSSPKQGLRAPPGTVVEISSLPRDPARREKAVVEQVNQLLDAAFPDAPERKSLVLNSLARSSSPVDTAAGPDRSAAASPAGLSFTQEMQWIKEHKEQGGQVQRNPTIDLTDDEMLRITKIQAVHRGRSARQVATKQQTAAVKIQAQVRGRQCRQQAALRADNNDAAPARYQQPGATHYAVQPDVGDRRDRQRWTDEEVEVLVERVRADGYGDWEQKAAALGTGRTGVSVQAKYDRYLAAHGPLEQ